MSLEQIVREHGFDSEDEFHLLVSSTPLESPEQMERFLAWRDKDGTKDGLLALTADRPEVPR